MKPLSLLKPFAALGALALLAGASAAQTFPWTQLTPTTNPTARERVATATDGTVLFMYGGQNGTTTSTYADFWSFDGTDWTKLSAVGTACGPRAGATMGYDSARGKLVVFSGKGDGGVWANYATDTWEWDAVNGWVAMAPTTSPDGRWLNGGGVYVPGVGVVFHGGNAIDGTGTVYVSNETWAWNGTNWSLLSSGGPTVQNGGLVYRSATHDLIYFAGQYIAGGTANADTHRYDIATNTWSQIVTATLPFSDSATGGAGLSGPTVYYNPITGKVVAHGGQGNGGPPSKLTWEFDGVDWTNVSDPSNAILRNASGQFVPGLGKAYSFGGNSSGSAKNWTLSHGPAAWGSFTVKGTACPTSAGLTATIATSGMPMINSNFVLDLGNLSPSNLVFALVGGSDTTTLGIPLPIPLGVIFSGSNAACSLQVSQDVGLFAPPLDGMGGASLTLPVPNDVSFVGLSVFAQGIQLEVPGFFATNTAYAQITLGQL